MEASRFGSQVAACGPLIECRGILCPQPLEGLVPVFLEDLRSVRMIRITFELLKIFVAELMGNGRGVGVRPDAKQRAKALDDFFRSDGLIRAFGRLLLRALEQAVCDFRTLFGSYRSPILMGDVDQLVVEDDVVAGAFACGTGALIQVFDAGDAGAMQSLRCLLSATCSPFFSHKFILQCGVNGNTPLRFWFSPQKGF